MNLAEELEQFVRGNVYVDEERLDKFSKDASIFKIRPEIIVAPKDAEDVKAIVKFVSKQKENGRDISITPRAAGTDMSGGPLTESIVLDFMESFQGILNINKEGKNVTVLPGTYYRDLEPALAKHKLLLPCYTASKSLNTVGGMVGNNSGGEKTLTYGKTEDYIKSLKVVFSDGNEYEVRPLSKEELDKKISQKDFEGNLYKEVWDLVTENEAAFKKAKPDVSKNSAGYYLWNVWDGETFDLTKVIVGSQGTLGVVTEITFNLITPKEHSTLLVVFLRDFSKLAQIVGRVLEYKPESFESYDDQTTKIAIKFLPGLVKKMGAKNLLSLGWKFWPEALMTLRGGLPKLVMVAEFTGDSEEEIYQKAYEAQQGLEDLDVMTRVTKTDAEEDKYWTVRRESFSLLREHVQGKHTAPFIDDVVVRPEFLPEFLPKLSEIMGKYTITYTIAGHIGDGNFHIIPLMDYNRPDFELIIKNLSKEVYDLVMKYEGSITAEHNDGLIRTPFLEQMFGSEIIELFSKTKDIFDPYHIMNPGKKVSEGEGKQGSFEYIHDHLLDE